MIALSKHPACHIAHSRNMIFIFLPVVHYRFLGMNYLLACEQREVHMSNLQLHCAQLSSLSWAGHSAYCVFIHSLMQEILIDYLQWPGTGLGTVNTTYQGHMVLGLLGRGE